MAVPWQNTFGDLDLYLMNVIIYLQETNDMRESSFFMSAECSKDVLPHFISHFFPVLKIQVSKDPPFKTASEVWWETCWNPGTTKLREINSRCTVHGLVLCWSWAWKVAGIFMPCVCEALRLVFDKRCRCTTLSSLEDAVFIRLRLAGLCLIQDKSQ